MFNKTLRTALLGSGAAVALMAGPAFAGETEDLKDQINQLQARLDQLEKQQTATTDANTAAAPGAPAAAPADAVVGGDFPGSFKLPGSDTSVAIHGYTKLDMIYSINARMGDSFVESSIPGNHSALNNVGPQFRAHARQSRLTFETRTPTNYGQIGTYIQGDFFGSAGSAEGNNSSAFRLRKAYATMGPWEFGQDQSLFNNADDGAETLDFEGPVGSIYARQALASYTYKTGKWKLAAGLENPAGEVGANIENSSGTPIAFLPGSAVGVGSGSPRTGANGVVDRMPDITARATYTDSWGDLNAAGVLRYFAVDNGQGSSTQGNLLPGAAALGTNSVSKDVIGGGGTISGTINVGNWIGGYFAKDQIGFGGYVGEGLNRYIDTSGRQGDAILTIRANGAGGSTQSLDTQLQYGGFFWILHNWTDTLRTNAVFGIDAQNWKNVFVNSQGGAAGTQLDKVESLHVNLIWSPVKSVNIGVEWMWGYNENLNLLNSTAGITGGSRGTANQVQFSAQYVF